MSPPDDSHFLRAARLACGITTAEAAQFVCASRRSWEGWESGSRPIPRSKLELLATKLDKLGVRKEGLELVVMIANLQGFEHPIDVVSNENYLGIEMLNDGQAVIKSLALDHVMKRPYVHRTQLNPSDNDHVISAAQRWASVAEN